MERRRAGRHRPGGRDDAQRTRGAKISGAGTVPARERPVARQDGAFQRSRAAGHRCGRFRFRARAARTVLGWRRGFRAVRAAGRRSRLRGGRQYLAVPQPGRYPAGGARGQPGRDRAIQGARHHRQSELFDDPDGGRAQADLRRRGHRAHQRGHLPVSFRRRPAGGGGTGAADCAVAERPAGRTGGHAKTDCLQLPAADR